MKPTLLVIATTYPACRGDGSPGFVADLCTELTRDFDVTVLAPRLPDGSARSDHDGVVVHRVPYWLRSRERLADGALSENIWARPMLIIQLVALVAALSIAARRQVRRGQVDAINVHWVLPNGIPGAIAVGMRRRIPLVLTSHGVDLHMMPVPPVDWIRGRLLRRADLVLPVSEELRERCVALGAPPDSPVIPMGADATTFADIRSRRQPGRGRFLFIGRIAEKKGLPVLLRAMQETSDATLDVVGDGPDRNACEALARASGLDARVTFHGRTSADGVATLMRTATAVVIPSIVAASGDREGTPVVASEALAAGVPLIATRVAGLMDVVTDGVNGRLVDPGDEAALTEVLQWATDRPDDVERLSTSEAAGERYTMRWTARRYAELIVPLIESRATTR